LSHGVQVAVAAWRAAMRIVAGVGDLVQRTGDGCTGRVLSGRAIERSGGAVCDLYRARGVSGLASKPLGRFLIGLGLKTDGDGL
jgi:hypothetical protein